MSAVILTGNLKIGADSGSAVEVGEFVSQFGISGKTDTIERPQTMGRPASKLGGATKWELTIGYVSGDLADDLWTVLEEFMNSESGEFYFEGTTTSGSKTYSGIALAVGDLPVGGDARSSVSSGSGTFAMPAAPDVAP